ncbi:MAG: hypothetical protein N2109_06890 [Fimbriimonadales bacterium]|nr:hypothetical protein [Fimbriimonadales bacterium]
MASLTKPYEAFERPGIVVSMKLATVKAFKGALMAVSTAGYLVPIAPQAAGLKFVGVANETVDNTDGNPGQRSVAITKAGSFVFKAVGFTPSQADIGKEAYAASDWEVQNSATGLGNAYKVGTIVALETTSTGELGVRVRIDNHTV